MLALVGCGAGPQTTAIIMQASVQSTCAGDGGCRPPMVSVGHCGSSVRIAKGTHGAAQAATKLAPGEVGAVVVVQHPAGDKPSNSGGGSSDRGWLLAKGERARVEALHQPDLVLYTVDEAGAVGEVSTALVASDDQGSMQFEYTSAGLSVTETHHLLEIAQRPLELTSPDDISNGCCASVPGPELVALFAVMLAVFRLRGRRAS